jgi:hypothetical protein
VADFFTRVELHGADSDDYETLHAAMRARGFFQAIIGHDGKTKRILPPAEYHKRSADTCTQVRDQAREAAQTTKLKNTVLSVKAEEWAGHFD